MSLNHRSVISTPQWQELREKRADLANELLEMVLDERSTSAMDVDGSPRADESIVEERQLTFRDMLPFRRGAAVLIGGGGGEVGALNPNAEAPQTVQAVRRVQPVRRVRQVVVEEQQEEMPGPQPIAKRARHSRGG